ncbi:MAG: nucleotidyltransferase domain-containing protein [bacterium]
MGTNSKEVAKVLFPGTKRKILILFFLNPDQEYYFSEVVRLTGTRQGAIQRELKSLAEADILLIEKRGRQKYFRVNKNHPIFKDLRNIIFKTFGVIDQIREALEPITKKISIAFVYGSFAKGDEISSSDIDLFIIGCAHLDEVVSALSIAEQTIKREINPILFSEKELKSKWSENNHFIRSVFKTEKEFIIGLEDEFRSLVK